MKTWYEIKLKAETDSAEISIFDEIGMWGVTAKQFIADLKTLAGKAVTLSINSPGGSVFDALAIYNALRGHGTEITTKVMGIAASAASLIFLAGDKRLMPENTFVMVHNPLTFAYGNAEELRDMAEVLDKIAASLVGTYVARSNKSEDEIKELLASDTYLNAADCLDAGFATHLVPEMKIAAAFDTDRLPENIRAAFEAPVKDDVDAIAALEAAEAAAAEAAAKAAIGATLVDEIAAYAATVGMSDYALAVSLATGVASLDDAKAKLSAGREIVSLCAVAGVQDMARGLVQASASLDEARKQIMDKLAADDAARHTSNVRQNDKPALAGAQVWQKIFPTAAQQMKEH